MYFRIFIPFSDNQTSNKKCTIRICKVFIDRKLRVYTVRQKSVSDTGHLDGRSRTSSPYLLLRFLHLSYFQLFSCLDMHENVFAPLKTFLNRCPLRKQMPSLTERHVLCIFLLGASLDSEPVGAVKAVETLREVVPSVGFHLCRSSPWR